MSLFNALVRGEPLSSGLAKLGHKKQETERRTIDRQTDRRTDGQIYGSNAALHHVVPPKITENDKT